MIREIFADALLPPPKESISEEVEQLVGFIVGDEEFAVPILAIQEIIKPIEWTSVPFTPDYVLGVFNLLECLKEYYKKNKNIK